MHFADLDSLAVIVSAVAFYAFGALWYMVLFGKAWAAEMGLFASEREALEKLNRNYPYDPPSDSGA